MCVSFGTWLLCDWVSNLPLSICFQIFANHPNTEKIFSRKFHYQGALISHKISKHKQDEGRNRKMLKTLRSVKTAL